MLNVPFFKTYIFNQHIYDTRYQCMFHWLSVARLQHQNLFIESTDVYSATAHSIPEIIIWCRKQQHSRMWYRAKYSWLYPWTSQLEGSKVIFFYYIYRVFRILVSKKPKSSFFKFVIVKFNKFVIVKFFDFILNLNDNFYEASFEVYDVSISQKLVILGFSPQIFFILTSVTSNTYEPQQPQWGLKF